MRNKTILQLAAILVPTFFSMFFVELLSKRVVYYVFIAFSYLFITFFWKDIIKSFDKTSRIYVIMILVMGILHIGINKEIGTPIYESFQWIIIICILCLLKSANYNKKLITRYVYVFILLECAICVFEKVTQTYIFSYSQASASATMLEAYEYDFEDFRARSLLLHPLFNSNVISIFLAFVICSKKMKKGAQIFFVCLGLAAIWACNSRACMFAWILLLTYRLLFYNKNLFLCLVSGLIIYNILPFVIDFLFNSGILGRLSLDLTDSSSETRFIAFGVFASQDWNLMKILIGGEFIRYPASEFTLENGILLNMGYWGWIVGLLKTILEIYFSYKCLSDSYELKGKLYIMAATWGIAFANNNSFMPFLFAYYVLIYLAMNEDHSDFHKYMPLIYKKER